VVSNSVETSMPGEETGRVGRQKSCSAKQVLLKLLHCLPNTSDSAWSNCVRERISTASICVVKLPGEQQRRPR
jgi:hypothetical protein